MIREIEHTADRGIEVEADDLGQLFREAAEGMVGIISEGRKDQPIFEKKIELKTTSLRNLLIKFLSEILYLVQDELTGYAGVEIFKLTERKLSANLMLYEAPEIFAEIKNVTYHNFLLEKKGEGYICRIIFDT